MYAYQTQEGKPYLTYPNYSSYVQLIDRTLKSPPYYKENQGPCVPVMYNYVQPVYPRLNEQCLVSPQMQYWYTQQ